MLIKLRPKSEFSRNVLTLITGTTIAQAIPIAISPIILTLTKNSNQIEKSLDKNFLSFSIL